MRTFVKWTLMVMIAAVLIPFGISYAAYWDTRVPGSGDGSFEKRLIGTAQANDSFAMADVTDFQWDTLHIFGPYLSKDMMEESVGAPWSGSYLDYLLEQTSLGQYPLDHDGLQMLVFVRGGKVVRDVTLYRSDADFTPAAGEIPREDAHFAVERGEGPPVVTRPE